MTTSTPPTQPTETPAPAPYIFRRSGRMVVCSCCNGNTRRGNYYASCEDCDSCGVVDEFYYQGYGTEPEGWRGNVKDPTGDKARARLAVAA